MSGVDEVLDDRGKNYGDFDGHARLTQSLKAAMKAHPNWDGLGFVHKEALEMIAHKIGRIVNGNPDYKDSWVDVAGYAQLVARDIP